MATKKTTKKKTTKEVALKDYSLDTVGEVSEMATILKDHIVKQDLFTNIKGKNYVNVEGWQFAGGLLGLTPIITKVQNLSSDDEFKYMAQVELERLSDGKIVSRGVAICSNKEYTKKSFDEYAICSMAQTRAVGKAYRNTLAWIMKMAGYQGTPSEEMDFQQKSGQATNETPQEPKKEMAGAEHKDVLRKLCAKLSYAEDKIETQAKCKIDDMTKKMAESIIKQLTTLLEKKIESEKQPKDAEIVQCSDDCGSNAGGICDCGNIPIV